MTSHFGAFLIDISECLELLKGTLILIWPFSFIWWLWTKSFCIALYIAAFPPVVILRHHSRMIHKLALSYCLLTKCSIPEDVNTVNDIGKSKRWCCPELGKRLCIIRVQFPKVLQTPDIEELLNKICNLVHDLEYAAKGWNDEKNRNQSTSRLRFDETSTLEKRLRSAHYELQEIKTNYEKRLKSMHSENTRLEREIQSIKQERKHTVLEERDEKELRTRTENKKELLSDSTWQYESLVKKDSKIEELENELELLKQQKEKLGEALQSIENEMWGLHDELAKKDELLTQKDSKIKELENELDAKIQEGKREGGYVQNIENDIKGLQMDLKKKEEFLSQKDSELEGLENELDATRQLKEELGSQLQSIENEVKCFKLEIRDAEDKLRVEVLKYEKSETENKELRQTLINREGELTDTKTQLKKSEAEKDDALKRLSEIMSLRLRDKNPNIVDLNDQYRPTKLAEMLNELYDNQWTDVFSYIEENWDKETEFSDETCIEFLLNILMETYIFCQDKVSEEWNEGINKILWTVNTDDDKELLKKLKDVRRKNAFISLPSVNKECVQHLNSIMLSEDTAYSLDQNQEGMKQYIEECVRVCWLMALQDPPVCLVCDGWKPNNVRELKNRNDNQIVDNLVGADSENGTENTADISVHSIDLEDDSQMDILTENNNSSGNNEQNKSSKGKVKLVFDKDLYKEYTRRGQYIDYIVWPLMYLHKGGPLLNKGVAQGCSQ